jgi:hypothetical protein
MVTINVLLLLVAFVCFVIATIGVPTSRLNVTALGLAFWVASVLLATLR